MSLRNLFILLSIISFFCLITKTYAQGAKLIDTFQSADWTAHIYENDGKRICFAASEPKQTLPANVRRGKIVFYISSWPADKVRNEVSIKIGYPFKAGSETTVEIGNQVFKLFVKDDKAFVADTQEENKLVAAIRNGNQMIVKGTSARGTLTTDQYSLSGVSAALNKIDQDCP